MLPSLRSDKSKYIGDNQWKPGDLRGCGVSGRASHVMWGTSKSMGCGVLHYTDMWGPKNWVPDPVHDPT